MRQLISKDSVPGIEKNKVKDLKRSLINKMDLRGVLIAGIPAISRMPKNRK